MNWLLYVDDYDDDFDDDNQYDDPIDDDGTSLSDDLPENKIFPKDKNQGRQAETKV